MKRVVIVGGGITGLAAAHALERASIPCGVRLVEAGPRLGGNLVTVRHNGFIIDGGPDSWIASKSQATRLAEAVGLSDELMGTAATASRVYIAWQGRLHPMPEGVVLGVPTSFKPFADTELFGLDTKLRALLEPLVPKKIFGERDDESIASFVARRLGADIAERVAGPLLGGIFAGDPESLSVRACVPQLVDAERRYGSLVLAMRALREERRAAASSLSLPPTTFLTLKRGIGDLVTNVAHRLRDAEVLTDCPVTSLSQLPPRDPRGRWAVGTARGPLYADDVALTTPAYATRGMVAGVDEELASLLGDLRYVSTATAFLAFRRADVRHPLDASGFLVPHAEGRPILACTFVSSKWDHRAPSGQVLLRVFFGGARGEHILTRDDAGLVQLAREQLRDLLGIERPPSMTRVFRFDKKSPQPSVGHLARMAQVMKRVQTLPGLHLGGSGLFGVGIPDAIRQGDEIAARIAGPLVSAGTRPSTSMRPPPPLPEDLV